MRKSDAELWLAISAGIRVRASRSDGDSVPLIDSSSFIHQQYSVVSEKAKEGKKILLAKASFQQWQVHAPLCPIQCRLCCAPGTEELLSMKP